MSVRNIQEFYRNEILMTAKFVNDDDDYDKKMDYLYRAIKCHCNLRMDRQKHR